jgi:putative ABC transport system permease protein
MPNWNHIVREHLAVLRLPPEREIEIVEEQALHLEAAYEDALAAGYSEAEAEARAAQGYDWRLLECELSRAVQPLAARAWRPSLELIERRGGLRMELLLQDLRIGARMLFKNPGFTLIAVLTLALGIGANTAIFSVVNAVLLRPLPYQEPQQLVMVWETDENNAPTLVAPANFTDWSEQSQSVVNLAAIRGWDANLTGAGEPERLRGAQATADLFKALGVQPLVGRAFLPGEDQEGSPRVVVLSYGLWRRRFGADASVVGKDIMINGLNRTVVGVMPPDFKLPMLTARAAPTKSELWTPWVMSANYRKRRDLGQLSVIARLKPGVTAAQAQAELSAISARQPRPETGVRPGAQVIPLHDNLVGDVRQALLVLLGAVGFVLLIACANVANLLLTRSAARRQEIAIRAALGADRWRVIQQLLTESLLLALSGGVLGLWLASWSTVALVALSPENLPRADEIGVDWRVLGFTCALSLLTGLVFGLAPAWQSSRLDLHTTLKESGRGLPGGRGRLSDLLVVSELALALALLAGAGLFVNSFWRLSRVDAGFEAAHALTLQVSLPGAKYPESAQQIAFFDQVIARVGALPGVQAVGVASAIPLTGWQNQTPFLAEGRQELSQQEELDTVSPDYFRAMGIPLQAGRAFNEQDQFNAPRVVIVSQGLARRYWPGENPVGKRLRFPGSPNEPWRTIVGVVGDIKQASLAGEATREYYLPHRQDNWGFTSSMTLVVRATVEPSGLIGAVSEQVRAVDKDLPIYNVKTMAQLRAQSAAASRFQTLLLGSFAAIALLLAAVGIYGVMAYAVARRTQELGLRLALGAQAGDVLKLVLARGLKLIFLGVAIGLLAALALTRWLETLLFGVRPTDPLTFGAIALVLIVIALLACWIPARRATKVDPLTALRHE